MDRLSTRFSQRLKTTTFDPRLKTKSRPCGRRRALVSPCKLCMLGCAAVPCGLPSGKTNCEIFDVRHAKSTNPMQSTECLRTQKYHGFYYGNISVRPRPGALSCSSCSEENRHQRHARALPSVFNMQTKYMEMHPFPPRPSHMLFSPGSWKSPWVFSAQQARTQGLLSWSTHKDSFRAPTI